MLTPKYEWEENEERIKIQVVVKGSNVKDVDVYVSDLLIKVNFQPYVLLLDLYDQIIDAKCSALFKNGILTIDVPKKTHGSWGNLQTELPKAEKIQRRNLSVERRREYDQHLIEKKKKDKHAQEKHSLRKQMALDQADRHHLEQVKEEEKQREEKAMYESIRNLKMEQEKKKQAPSKEIDTIFELNEGEFDISNEAESSEEDIISSEEDEIVYIPEPRAPVATRISFTPRIFPTPCRESKANEEEDWMLKNRKHLKTHKGLNSKYAHDISETDPIWLKAKGDDFYRSRDFQSAANAYTEALEFDSTLLSCLSNRAACYLKLGQNESCVDDCNVALTQLPETPPTDADRGEYFKNRRMRLKLLIRRGSAYCQLGMFTEAKADYGFVVTQNSNDESLKRDLARITIMEQCGKLKQQGDALFSSGDRKKAIEQYSQALQLDPSYISCASNRAACYLAVGDAAACVKDCTLALDILQKADGNTERLFVTSVLPATGTEKRRNWVLKTLVRRGTALMQLKELKKAEQDFSDALSLDPKNEKLLEDVKKIREAVSAP